MIRQYQAADLDPVIAVWGRASRMAHRFLDESFLAHEREMIATVWLTQAETWVFVRTGAVAGFISLVGNAVGGLFVDPPLHGQGIGRALVDHVAALRCPLEVEVFEANNIGRRFYNRYGFTEIQRSVHEMTGQPVVRLRLGSR